MVRGKCWFLLRKTQAWGIEHVVVSGSGADIWQRSDGFQYACQRISGDGDISARVTNVDDTGYWVKPGVIIRESLDPGSRDALVDLTRGGLAEFIRRTSTGASATSVSITGSAASPAVGFLPLIKSASLVLSGISPVATAGGPLLPRASGAVGQMVIGTCQTLGSRRQLSLAVRGLGDLILEEWITIPLILRLPPKTSIAAPD